MNILRIINGEEITITLSKSELTSAYKEKLYDMQCTEVRKYLSEYSSGELFDLCDLGDKARETWTDSQIDILEKAILKDSSLHHKIYKKFSAFQKYHYDLAYNEDMGEAVSNVLQKEGKKYVNNILSENLTIKGCKPSLAEQIQTASTRAAKSTLSPKVKTTEPEIKIKREKGSDPTWQI